jgi:HEAT repeat protein
MRTALNDPELEMRLNVSGALMFKGDSSGLEVVKTAFLAGIPLPANFEELVSNQVSELGDLHDPKLVPDLEQLLGSNSLYMRRGASFALMRTRSPDAKTGLKKALVDSDLQVRFNGVVGLAEIGEEREWRPSLEEFRANESRYLSHFSK